ncbi:MAG: DNA-binding response OmpR family regulator [Cellvibrionaceae bacterium]
MHNLKKIIYIDDQTDILLIAEYALTKIGKYDALMCESGAEALAEIDDYKPDLILIDVMMPELSGPETLSKIREKALFKATPAIFITAKIFQSEVTELMSCNSHVIGVIPKPFDPTTVSATIQSVWDSSFSKYNQESLS